MRSKPSVKKGLFKNNIPVMAKTVLVPAKVRMLALNTINFGRVEESSRLG